MSFQLELFKQAFDNVPVEDKHDALMNVLGKTTAEQLVIAIGEVYDDVEVFDVVVGLQTPEAEEVDAEDVVLGPIGKDCTR